MGISHPMVEFIFPPIVRFQYLNQSDVLDERKLGLVFLVLNPLSIGDDDDYEEC
jgi:hypothetical protein